MRGFRVWNLHRTPTKQAEGCRPPGTRLHAQAADRRYRRSLRAALTR